MKGYDSWKRVSSDYLIDALFFVACSTKRKQQYFTMDKEQKGFSLAICSLCSRKNKGERREKMKR